MRADSKQKRVLKGEFAFFLRNPKTINLPHVPHLEKRLTKASTSVNPLEAQEAHPQLEKSKKRVWRIVFHSFTLKTIAKLIKTNQNLPKLRTSDELFFLVRLRFELVWKKKILLIMM